jgi:hypothetical protein
MCVALGVVVAAAAPTGTASAARRRTRTSTTVAATSTTTSSTLPPKPTGPPPELVLAVRDPFSPSYDIEETVFAFYRNGTVIYRDGDVFRETKLAGDGLRSIRRELAPTEEFFGIDGHSDSSVARDARSYIIVAWRNGKPRALAVENDPTEGPEPFQDLYERILAFRSEFAPQWQPARYELLLRPFKYNAKSVPPWPRGWPTTNATDARRIGEVVRVVLTAEQQREFVKRYASAPALVIEGQTWAFVLRTPFPTEEAWISR